MRYGGLTGGTEYLIQMRESSLANTLIEMPTSPGRQQIQFMYQYYPSIYNWQYF